MITLYSFGPYFGLPDGSPFVVKAMLLLRFAGLPFKEDRGGYFRAPKGRLPYIEDDGVIIADSTFIRFHIEKKYGFDFDAGLSPEQRASAWAVEKMCEEHLNLCMLAVRWADLANFVKGPTHFFDAAPTPLRAIMRSMARRKVRKNLVGHGFGRHAPAEIAVLGARDIDALATLLGDKPFLMGDEPCSADAAVWAFVAHFLAKRFDTPIRTAAEGHGNLLAYRDRLMRIYFPDCVCEA
jgi:glutathione S-transferase